MTVPLTVLVVSFNTREMTLACLRSVFESKLPNGTRVVVVDNASSDGSADAIDLEFEDRLELIRLGENVGFAAGNNVGAARVESDWLLLLNPDTLVLENAIETLHAFAIADAGFGIVGGRTVFADHAPNPASCWMRPTPWSVFCQALGLTRFSGSSIFNAEQPDAWSRGRPRHVDIVSGCFFMIRTALWKQLGGFDESFFMYGEEADLCLRARAAGANPAVTDDAVIVHYGGASEKVRSGKLLRLLHAKYRLCGRHWKFAFLARPLVALWPASRVLAFALLSRLKPRYRESYETWRTVWKGRREWLNTEGGYDAAGTITYAKHHHPSA